MPRVRSLRELGWLGLVATCCLMFQSAELGATPAEAVPEVAKPKSLQLEHVLRSVERNHPLLLAASREVDAARAESTSALGGFDTSWKTKGTALPAGYYDGITLDSTVEQPTALWGISPFVGYRLGLNDFPSYDGKYRTLRYGEVRAGVNVPLWRNGPIDRRRANLAKAELGTEIAELSYQQQRIEFTRAASHRYWAWVAAGRKLEIAEELLSNVELRQAALSARVQAGDLPTIDEADNARALEQRRAQLAQAERSFEQAAIELSLFLRNDAGDAIMPERWMLPTTWPALERVVESESTELNRALKKRPEPRRLDLQREQHTVELDFATNQQAPGVDLQVVGSQDFGPPISERPDLRRPVVEVGLFLDVPLQNRVNEGRAAMIRAQIERTAQQQRFASDRVAADIRDALSAIARTEQRITTTRREVELARKLEVAERERFEIGDSQLLIVNIREQQTAEAELREVDALFDYHRAIADFRAARGLP